MQACEKIEKTNDQTEHKSSRTSPRQNKTRGKEKGKCEGNNNKTKDTNADILKDAVEIHTKDSMDKRQDEPLGGEETVYGDVPLSDDQKSTKSVISVSKIRNYINKIKDLDSSTKSLEKRGQEETKQPSAQCRLRLPSKRNQKTSTDAQEESSDTDCENGNGHRSLKHPMPDFEEEKGLLSSELSMEISSPEFKTHHAVSPSNDDTEEEIQLPIVVLKKEPSPVKPGSFVWCKFQHYPYWPSLVTLVDSRNKRATIIFLEESISDPSKKNRSFKVALRSIKLYDCPEKQQFLENARKDYGRSIDWCESLISDYRIRLGCGSFSGSFLDYCTAAISLPVRRELESGKQKVLFPVIDSEETDSQEEMIGVTSQRDKKLLPDRARAARDCANKKLVQFIVKAKGAENHLVDILSGKKKSQWLVKFQSSNQRMNFLETYIEDEEQMEHVVGYLKTVCKKMSSATKKLMLGDEIKFIFEVLIPEAVIFAIAATEKMSYEKAKVKYIKGPPVTRRERKIFDEQILEKKRLKMSEEAKVRKNSRK
ncbi:PWWP domain-containing DNA repair factor 3A isoform X1 [Bufo gargarizans]|uniref:PWWP domain-containing DNA repair factor 3A isoform X1 n=1 Tax=Bufo gargarizans TaxID=30331 RepID=UPI001CF4EA64|nr:PWWP domain-containing DNA repair factor 3A isoform X1 [Bufo gargarizans]XP_044125186.1 PWWP domain-containing DNA repair factor 3A isoform X1 [Bufo gargarizans]XP_044125194.1 PWWP domain-containing DNA repair factor 3A isoform X1 [Bufo gargarizans]